MSHAATPAAPLRRMSRMDETLTPASERPTITSMTAARTPVAKGDLSSALSIRTPAEKMR